MTYTIYKITNPEGKIYIGCTSNFEKRMQAYRGNGCASQPKIHESINSFGFDAHTVEVLESDTTQDRESFYINMYDAIKSGLNGVRTGRKPKDVADRVQQKKVYLSDDDEALVLKNTGKKSLTEVVKMYLKS